MNNKENYLVKSYKLKKEKNTRDELISKSEKALNTSEEVRKSAVFVCLASLFLHIAGLVIHPILALIALLLIGITVPILGPIHMIMESKGETLKEKANECNKKIESYEHDMVQSMLQLPAPKEIASDNDYLINTGKETNNLYRNR